jgi:menaquinone-dependent protoporphyrinogen oxidase
MKILVAVASKHGSTMEIATEIGKAVESALLDQGDTAEIDVLFADTVTSMKGYDGVILGSAVYMGHWLDSMRKFADAHGDALRALPVWLFSTGPVDGKPDPTEAGVDGEQLAVTLCAREHRMFGGKIDKSGLHFGERAAVTLLRVKDGDYRDWPSIRDWAKEISASLHETHSGV